MIGMELIVPGSDREPNPAAAKKVLNEALSRGMLMYPCGVRSQVIRVAPPLNITREQIDEGLRILDQSLATV